MRQVPFIIAALYGGYRYTATILLFILIFPYHLRGDVIYLNLFVILLIAAVVPLFAKIYEKFSLAKKVLFTVAISELCALLTISLANYFIGRPVQLSAISLNYFVIQGLSTWLMVYLVENMFRNYKLKEELIKAEKLSVISQISASISHEIKNPITITQGFVEALEDEECSERRKEYASYALEELQRAQEIIHEFLALTKPDKDEKEKVSLSQQLLYAVKILKPYARSFKVNVILESFDKDCFIFGYKQRVRQCFINLIKNAIEAMENGGQLRIKLVKTGDKVHIDIIDTGVGMTQEEIERLGTPYYTTKEKGTGLGMVVVFNAIKNMNGKIKIESEKGKGTHFMIDFPIAL